MKILQLVLVFVFTFPLLHSQTVKELSLDEVINIAGEQSPHSILARHIFLGKYWEYRTYKAKYLPELGMDVTMAEFRRRLEKEYNFGTGEERYVEKFSNSSSARLSLSQNVGLTGGSIYAASSFERFDRFGTSPSHEYITQPAVIGFNQPIFSYNPLKWEKKIEPIKYEEARKSYITSMEQVYQMSVARFFDLALAQMNLDIAKFNFHNSDTLYRIAEGRYNIGTIAEDELLQMQLKFLNSKANLNSSQIDLQDQEFRLRSFLGYNETVKLELIMPTEIPHLTIEVDEALSLAYRNNPQILAMERELLEASKGVAQAKGKKGVNANLNAMLGLAGSAVDPLDAYTNLLDNQMLNLSFSVPILDWGQGRGRYQMAKSSQEVVKTNIQQDKIDFDQEVFLSVSRFNLQDDQLLIASKSDTIANKRYDVARQRFLIGKIDVLQLNVADSEKDVAKRNYVTALRSYWASFYNVRKLTLYDFIKQEDLSADFESMIDE